MGHVDKGVTLPLQDSEGADKWQIPSLLKDGLVTLGLGHSKSVPKRTSPQGSPLNKQKNIGTISTSWLSGSFPR